MPTLLKLGPADHGRPLTLEEYEAAEYAEGYQYELIDGKLYVSPQPNPPENLVEHWLFRKLLAYSDQHPEVTNHVTNKGRLFVPDRPGVTNPEPDVTAFREFPLEGDWDDIRWQEQTPILVAEVISHDDPNKDLVRNVELYLAIPSIKEYWLLDNREDRDQPQMTVYRRRGKQWRTISVVPGETYTTRLLPGFSLTLNPRA